MKAIRTRGALLGVVLSLIPITARAQDTTTTAPQGSVTIQGKVIDSEARTPVDLVEVVIVGASRPTYTDEKGRFTFAGIAPGTYTLSATRLGFVPLRRQLVVVSGQNQTLDLHLTQNAVPLEQVTVTPGTFSFMGQGTSTHQTMSREDIKSVPMIGEDIFRAVNRLPGLASNDYAAHFGIRGGLHTETLILLDGLQLYEPYHLKDFNEGAISIIDANTIDGVQLMTGGFPARYGNKRSGVFDVTSRIPESKGTTFDVSMSFLNTHALAMGAFAGGKGSWLTFARAGYMGLVFQFIDQADLPKPQYGDGFAKVSYDFSSKQKLSLEFLTAIDKYVYDIPATTGFLDTINTREKADNHFGNNYVWGTLNSTLSTHTNVRTTMFGGWVSHSRQGSERDVLKVLPYYVVDDDKRYNTFGATQDWAWSASEGDIVTFGADVRQMNSTDTFHSTAFQDPDDPEPPPPGEFPVIANGHFQPSGTQFGSYLSNRWRVTRPLVLETGVRYDQTTWTHDNDVSPRVSAAYSLGRGMSLRLGWGLYRQMQNIDDLAIMNGDTTFFRSERTDQWTASWDRSWDKGANLRIEGYYKKGTHLRPVFRNWKGAVDAFPEPNEDRIKVTPRENSSQGVEVYYDRPLGSKLVMRASYSYSISNEDVVKIENVNSNDPLTYDLHHATPQDQRHAANVDFTYRLGSYQWNGSFSYHSGWPATLEEFFPVLNDLGQPDYAIRPQKLYAARLPDYMRFDLRGSRKWSSRYGDFSGWIEVINLTNHENVFGYDYFKNKDASGAYFLDRGDELWFTIMPSIGVSWTVHI
jgi:outer membrane receptor for ferrienterochelin and colicin